MTGFTISATTAGQIRRMVLRPAVLRARQVRADPRYVHWRRWGTRRRDQFDAMLGELAGLLSEFRDQEGRSHVSH